MHKFDFNIYEQVSIETNAIAGTVNDYERRTLSEVRGGGGGGRIDQRKDYSDIDPISIKTTHKTTHEFWVVGGDAETQITTTKDIEIRNGHRVVIFFAPMLPNDKPILLKNCVTNKSWELEGRELLRRRIMGSGDSIFAFGLIFCALALLGALAQIFLSGIWESLLYNTNYYIVLGVLVLLGVLNFVLYNMKYKQRDEGFENLLQHLKEYQIPERDS